MAVNIVVEDTGAASQPEPDTNLALYLATYNSEPSSASPLQWGAADRAYDYAEDSLGLFDPPDSLSLSWSGADTNVDRYLAPHHLLVDDGGELPLSDYSYTTGTRSDTGSHGSSKPLLPPGETLLTENPWRRTSSYSPQGQDTLFPHLKLVDPATIHTGVYLYDVGKNDPSIISTNSLFPAPPGPNLLSHPPHVNVGCSNPNLLSAPPHEIFSNRPRSRSPLSSPLSVSSPQLFPSNEDSGYISLQELSAPYIPNYSVADSGSKSLSSSDDADVEPPVRLTRSRRAQSTRGGKRRAHGARANGGPTISLAETMTTAVSNPFSKRRRSSSSSSSTTSSISQTSISLHKRPKRNSIPNEEGTSFDGSESRDDGDSDIYLPSRSPTPYSSPIDDTRFTARDSVVVKLKERKGGQKSKGMIKLGAAEALAHVAAESSKYMNESRTDDEVGWQPMNTFRSSTARRNRTIPLPVPVPHLNKRSRGRKVPYVDTRAGRTAPSDDDHDASGSGSRGTPSKRGRGGNRSAGGGRSFVCVVPGCGKCFVRGEHLKRHVRSIHTHEKPHPCPYEGCEKSFSRRDNLGQHVRLHLMESD